MIYLTAYKEFNPDWMKLTEQMKKMVGKDFEWLDLKANFQSTSYPHEEEIAKYLEEKGEQWKIAVTGYSVDVVTGETIGNRKSGRSDGVMSWPYELAYYVRKYHLRLPMKAEDHILNELNLA